MILISIYQDTFDEVLRKVDFSPEDLVYHSDEDLVFLQVSVELFTMLVSFDPDMDIAMRQAMGIPPRSIH